MVIRELLKSSKITPILPPNIMPPRIASGPREWEFVLESAIFRRIVSLFMNQCAESSQIIKIAVDLLQTTKLGP